MPPIIDPVAAKVEEAILDHAAFTENVEISAAAKGSLVTLRGSVPSRKYHQLAEAIAKEVQGVSRVINQMEIDPTSKNRADSNDLDDESQVPPARSGPHARN